MVRALRVLLLFFSAMLLKFGVLGEVVQTRKFVAVDVVGDGLAIDGNDAGDIAIFGFDDELGGVAALVNPTQQVLHRAMGLLSVQPMLDGAAYEGGRVEWCGGCGLCRWRGRLRQAKENDGRASRCHARQGAMRALRLQV